jgi:Concanavalin A-like lectin/glucanases superfamily
VISAESHLYLTVFNTSQQVTEYFTTDLALAANLWQHVAVTYDGNAGAGQKVKFYINGASVAANVNSDAGGTPANNSLAARIGLLGNGLLPYSGQIDEMEMFSRVLSATEVQALFAASAGGKRHPTPTPTPTPAPVTVTLTASPTDVTEGGKARYNIQASAVVAQDTTVNYAMSGTASLGSDYRVSAPPGQATILAGQTSVGVKLEAKKDSATEGTETAIMTLQAGSGYQIGNPNQATISIADAP